MEAFSSPAAGRRVRDSMLKGLQKLKQTVTLTPSSPAPPASEEHESREVSRLSHANTNTGAVRIELGELKASTAPRALDGVGLYEMLSVDEAGTQREQSEPIPYRFRVPEGFKQLTDPQTTLGTNTFVYGQDSHEYLALRGRMTVLDTTMSKIRQQMEWLHQELMVLETEKLELTQQLHNLPLHDHSCTEFTITLLPRRPVEALPVPDEELQDLMRRAEATAMSELPHGGEYAVLHSSEHACSSSGGGSASQRSADPAEWRAWEMHCQTGALLASYPDVWRSERMSRSHEQAAVAHAHARTDTCTHSQARAHAHAHTGQRHVGVVVMRRKYLPDTGERFQDISLSMSALHTSACTDLGMFSSEAGDLLRKLRRVAESVHAVATKRHPLTFDRIDIRGNLEKLQNDEGYMNFFQRHLPPPDNRPSMSDLADKVPTVLAPEEGKWSFVAVKHLC